MQCIPMSTASFRYLMVLAFSTSTATRHTSIYSVVYFQLVNGTYGIVAHNVHFTSL